MSPLKNIISVHIQFNMRLSTHPTHAYNWTWYGWPARRLPNVFWIGSKTILEFGMHQTQSHKTSLEMRDVPTYKT